MIRRSPSRNHRSKGIKVKHVLQIILLLGVCFWLIYQVKRSHDKKKEFDENNAHVSVGTQTKYGIPKLGRKDLHPGKGEVNQNEEHEEEVEYENTEEEDENKHELNEREGEEQGNGHETDGKADDKHGVKGGEEEQEEDEDKIDEMEDERGGGDDEIDENDQERSEVDDTDRDELMDEEKEKEESDEKENENTEDEETEGAVGNHNNHEAREEHYKGDDASSAVTHDTNTTSTETETVSLENSDDNVGMSIMTSENKANYTEESSSARNQTDSDIKVTEVELAIGGTSDATSGKEIGNNSLSDPVDSSHLNSTATTLSGSHSDASSNPAGANPGASNNMTQSGAHTSSEQNKTGIFSELQHGQNDIMNATATVDMKNVQQDGNNVSEENPDSKATTVVKTENGDAAAGESASLEGGGLEKTRRFVASNETEKKDNTDTSDTIKTRNNSYVKENTNASATDNEKLKGVTQTGETGESSDSSTGNGTANSIDHNAADSSDSHILKDVTESHTDPGTLPDIRNEGDNSDKTATE